MRPPLSYVPLLPIALGLASGIAVARFFAQYQIGILTILAAGGIVLLAMRRSVWGAGFVACACGVGLIWAFHPAVMEDGDVCEATYTGQVINVKDGDASRRLEVAVDELGYNCILTTPAFNPPLVPGDSMRFVCALQPVDIPQCMPSVVDMDTYYFTHRIGAKGFVLPDKLYRLETDWSLRRRLTELRLRVIALIMRSDLSQGTSSLLAATFMGDRDSLDQTTLDNFRDSGAAHLLAISGLHAGLVWMIIGLALWPMRLVGMGRMAKLMALALLWCYVVVSGMAPSVMRAAVMVSMVGASQLLERSNSVVNALLAAVILILVISPEALFDVGFQLSFVAVAGLIVWGAWFNSFTIRRKWLRIALSTIGVTMAAMLATSMFSAYYFHRLPLLFLLANVPLAVIFPIFLALGIVWLMSVACGAQPAPLADVLNCLYEVMDCVVSSVASAPGAVICNIYLTPWAVVVWMIMLSMLAGWVYYRRCVWGYASMACMITVVVLSTINPAAPTPELIITSCGDHTAMVVNDGQVVRVFTIGMSNDSAYHNEYWREYLADYAGSQYRRNVVAHGVGGGIITVGGVRWLIVNSDNPAYVECDALIVTKGFGKGASAIENLAKRTGAAQVLVSGDVDYRIANRINGIASPRVINLRDSLYRVRL